MVGLAQEVELLRIIPNLVKHKRMVLLGLVSRLITRIPAMVKSKMFAKRLVADIAP
jgi:hypothetical protein